jgi:hypothetical protein
MLRPSAESRRRRKREEEKRTCGVMWYDDDDVLLLPVKFLLLPLAAVGAVRVCGRRRSTISLYYLTYLVSLFSPLFFYFIFFTARQWRSYIR